MRVKVKNVRTTGGYDFGEFLGLILDNGCDRCGGDTPVAVIRKDNYGLMLCYAHPSTLEPVTPEEEKELRS